MFKNVSTLKKYFTATQEIFHALSNQKLASDLPYKSHFRMNIRGKAPSDPANSYPEHVHARNVSKLVSKVRTCFKSSCLLQDKDKINLKIENFVSLGFYRR